MTGLTDFLSQTWGQVHQMLYQTYQVAVTHTMVNVTTIILLGVFAQWFAWYFHLPAILLLLFSGLMAGPVLGVVNPDQLLGNLLTPMVSLSVAIILFEGGLNLKVSDLKQIGHVVRRLISVGALVTWTFSTILAQALLPLKFELCLLFGAILTVTGPTVIIPMLRQIKPDPKVASILRWEGILIDPVGATLAVVVFEIVLIGTFRNVPQTLVFDLGKIMFAGLVTGSVGAYLLYVMFKHHLAPEYLHNSLSFGVVLGIYSFSNQVQEESGLFAVTLAGILLGYQQSVSVRHILQFKENLQVLLISTLFILLPARLRLADFQLLDWRILVFTLGLIFLVRPLSVFLSTIGSDLKNREKIYLAFLAPRGIVAASVASIFSIKLSQAGHLSASLLIPYTFAVIVITVLFYGITAGALARYLGVSQVNPQGTIIVGAHDWARAIGLALQSHGIPVLLLDKNPLNVRLAREAGLPALEKSVLAEDIPEEVEISSFRRIVCLTSNDTINSLAQARFQEFFDSQDIFQLPLQSANTIPAHLCAHFLFTPDHHFLWISRAFNQGKAIQVFAWAEWVARLKQAAAPGEPEMVPLAMVDEKSCLHWATVDAPLHLDQARVVVAIEAPQAT